MKRLFYFVLLLVGVSTIHSCKELLDEDGNPLLDINTNSGLNGPRALYREITDSDTLATYSYSGLQVNKVTTPGINPKYKSFTDVAWSGDKISRIDFKGHLDLDDDDALDEDSVTYTQLYTYNNVGKLTSISENRSVFKRGTPVPPAVLGPYAIFRKSKTIYNLKYSNTTSKLASITMQTGEDVSPFNFTNYSETTYEYSGDNVSNVVRQYGPMTGSVFGAPVTKYGYAYSNYDSKINPFTLLPFAYKISRILSTEINDVDSWILSPNSPKRYSVTDLMQPIPSPAVFSTDYNYDLQTYMQKGYGVNYIYKPL
ncbi:hypothetical protein QFZ37_000297 [Chryseobacterium ginsenosidimutans]|uniref:hypothetical protein n=1 Tax=Chryseobacterium ginsenosidimutans TaxID=687846 RepID=UPI0027829482|nr:hypothetical protein [Chryseobacterium ginsenosidimutans]MDQ0591928.1 hypothetical protein [Chryseobacterium ginsenosidimutans]